MRTVVYRAEDDRYRLEIFPDDSPESPREWDNLSTMVCSHRRYDLGDERAKNTEYYDSWVEWLEEEVLKPNGGEDKVVYMPLYLYDHSGITMSTGRFSCVWDSGQVGWIYAEKKKLLEETSYTEDELFSSDIKRKPKVGEHVRIERFGKDWGKVVRMEEGEVEIDFDYHKIPNYRDKDKKITVYEPEVLEVMSERAFEIMENEVATYDMYLKGNVYGFVLEKKIMCDCCGSIEYECIDSCWGFYADSIEELVENLDGNLPREASYLLDKLEYVY